MLHPPTQWRYVRNFFAPKKVADHTSSALHRERSVLCGGMGCGASSTGGSAALSALFDLVHADSAWSGDLTPLQPSKAASLRTLSLRGCNLGHSGGKAIAGALHHMRALEVVDLGVCNLGVTGVVELSTTALAKGVPSRLTVLSLADNLTGAASKIAVSALARSLATGRFSRFAVLNLSDNSIEPEGGVALASAIKTWAPPLRELLLADCHCGATGISALCGALQTLPTARSKGFRLDLFSNQCGPQGCAVTCLAWLLDLHSRPRLRKLLCLGLWRLGLILGSSLCLAWCAHSGGALADLLMSGAILRQLGVQGGALGPEGTEMLANGLLRAGVATAARLESLDLSANGVGIGDGAGCAALARALTTTMPAKLAVLNLAENSLHDGDPNTLLEALGAATSLTWLDLSSNRLRAKAIAPLCAALRKLRHLATLGMCANERLGDPGVAELITVALEHLPALRELRLCDTGAGEDTASAAQRLLRRQPSVLVCLDLRANAGLAGDTIQATLQAAAADASPEVTLMLPGSTDDHLTALDARKMWIEWLGESVVVEGLDEGGEANQAPVTVG